MVVPTLATKVKTRPRSSGATVAWKTARMEPLATAAREPTTNGSDAEGEESCGSSPRASVATPVPRLPPGPCGRGSETSPGSEREPAADGAGTERQAWDPLRPVCRLSPQLQRSLGCWRAGSDAEGALMRDGTARDRFIAKALVEARSSLGVGTQPKDSVAPVGAGFEVRHECPTDSGAAAVPSDVQMSQAADSRILDIRVGCYATNGNELILNRHAKKELARVVEVNSLGGQIIDEPLDEGEPLGLTEGCEFLERSEVPDSE